MILLLLLPALLACSEPDPKAGAFTLKDTVEVVRVDTLREVIRDTLRETLWKTQRDTLILSRIDTVYVQRTDTLYLPSRPQGATQSSGPVVQAYIAGLERWKATHPEWKPYSEEYYKRHSERLAMLRKKESLTEYEKENLKYLESWARTQSPPRVK